MSDPAASGQVSTKKPSVASLLLVGGGVLLVVAVIAGLLVPAIAEATARAKITACAGNLRMLYTMQLTYVAQFGGETKEFPTEAGSAFWLKMTRTTPPLVDQTEIEIFLCPVLDTNARGTCEYLGPARPYKSIPGGDAVGADRKANHRRYGGGNILRKSGDVLELPDADFLSVCDKLTP